MIHKRAALATMTVITCATLAVVIGVNATANDTTAPETVATVPAHPALPACEQEDGSTQRACYWDAQRMGNGKGWSMIHMNYGKQTIIVSWLPAPCKAVSQLPGYELPASKDNAIRGLVSGVEMINMLRDAKLSDAEMARECTAYLYQWSADHPKAV